MSEKRFKLSKFVIPSELSDFCDENGRMLNSEVVRMLNDRDRQQEANIKMFFKYQEQQATIRKLQDLCGESDYENAKLRIENKKLKEMNEQLRKDKEQLKERLRECGMRLDRFNCR